ncbi:hypothetical protein SAMN02745824_3077 [Parasphingorhabdus marina DSM 22363]|uniref:Uncharacterized protein n=1 Tax=Parasphingorhabdus marina DSM 22363 TaxID=1123272 RepID=A0A1N6H0C2_9SPHN|nr:hypothetical protein [Parasphingorhabdus marina]SIO13250.1 hypothetical protein SAMN02745824_3077 [Parasphingorhabdus marina DSM 22363]
MNKTLVTGLLAGLTIFAAGFVLGIIRTLWLVPQMPAWQAVLIEGPVILTLTWFVLRFWVRRGAISAATSTRLMFGGMALITLWLCEWIMTIALMTEDPGFFFRSLATLPGAMGLAGQLLIIFMPLWMKPGQDPIR